MTKVRNWLLLVSGLKAERDLSRLEEHLRHEESGD